MYLNFSISSLFQKLYGFIYPNIEESSSYDPIAGGSNDNDVLVIGGGLAGIYTTISLKKLGFKVTVLERGAGPGGVWYWNKYPGARFDSESYTYMFTFSQELLDEWDWKEHFSSQPDTLRYINYMVDKFGVRENFCLNTEVKTARFDSQSRTWCLIDTNGNSFKSRFLINCLGPLTEATLPALPGVETFKGPAHHTARWPDSSVDLSGKRVGVIGTGATGIQVIQEVAKTAKELTVFQRTANWTAPLRNSPISRDEMKALRKQYPEIINGCKTSPFGFMYQPDTRKAKELSKEEREAVWEDHYNRRGLIKWVGNFIDTFKDEEANALYCEWMANKIRSRVDDPVIAEKLIPKNHGFGTRRVPLEDGYYELFNEPHVKLVDLLETPIERITEDGIVTSNGTMEFDVLIYATGFDAVTGAYEQIDYIGENGKNLRDVWDPIPWTYLGIGVPGFPNMFNILGPHQATGNIPHVIEYAVNWVSRYLIHLRENGITYVNAQADGANKWTDFVVGLTKGNLAPKVNSPMTGYNSNRPNRQHRRVIRYFGHNLDFRQRIEEVAADDYRGFIKK